MSIAAKLARLADVANACAWTAQFYGAYLRRSHAPVSLREQLGLVGSLFSGFPARRTIEPGRSVVLQLRPRDVLHPLLCRAAGSDLYVFRQVFLERQYACLGNARSPELIVDCGANVGYTSAYFLTRFPRARLIAIEPDPDSFCLLQANLKPYGERAEAVNSGVWSHSCGLVLSEGPYRDGLAWARQVRECLPGEKAQMTAVSLDDILKRSGAARISLLKMDIERAEAVVFSANYEGWLGRVDSIAIELHDEECAAVFRRAIEGQDFAMSSHGELTVCRRKMTARQGAWRVGEVAVRGHYH
jgi:FkbM family methyltransferase